MSQDEVDQLRAERDQALEKFNELRQRIRPLAEQAKRAGQQTRPGHVVHIGPSEPIDIAPNAVPIKVQATTSFWAGFTFTIGAGIAGIVIAPLIAIAFAMAAAALAGLGLALGGS